uniref:Putative secreted protein n=1 Tax=Anopheles triannulatus TaxID=58253 RepID=A0A2M4B1A5_9DIPT
MRLVLLLLLVLELCGRTIVRTLLHSAPYFPEGSLLLDLQNLRQLHLASRLLFLRVSAPPILTHCFSCSSSSSSRKPCTLAASQLGQHPEHQPQECSSRGAARAQAKEQQQPNGQRVIPERVLGPRGKEGKKERTGRQDTCSGVVERRPTSSRSV